MTSQAMKARDSFMTFKDTGERTPNYNLRVFTHMGKRYVDVTPMYLDQGKEYAKADEYRTFSNGNSINAL